MFLINPFVVHCSLCLVAGEFMESVGLCCRLLAISASQLRELLLFHVWSINPVVFGGPTPNKSE